jgi:single-stranded-DNA-specific exonuclease
MSAPIVRRDAPSAVVASLIAHGIPPLLARVYAARGIASHAELDSSLASLPSFAALRNIDAAADRLADAIARRERIVVVADYDADGATACAVAVRGLRAMNADVDFVVPNRFEYGYGLTAEIVALAARLEPRIIVTVDNGIASHDGVAAAAARGIDVLVTDHHLPAPTLPAPAIIINPNQPGCDFPCKNLAGVGVMFYVLAALRARLRERASAPLPNLAELLDLVALGTVADVVSLDHVNRILVGQGLARIRAGRAQPGVAALFEVAQRDAARARAEDLGFIAGPRLNAAGRLADMSLGIRCLLAKTRDEALPLARELDRLNRERRELEAEMQEQALADVAQAEAMASGDGVTLCLFRPEWHAGVVGIVASRLKERFHRPAIVFARGSDGELKGSGRSIAGLHLRDALDLVAKRAPGSVIRFGGHARAAGVTVREETLPDFAAAFEAVARAQLAPAALLRQYDSDGELAPGELSFDLACALRDGVWGQGFPAPAFEGSFGVEGQRIVAERHLRVSLTRGSEHFQAIAFGCTEMLPPRIEALFRPEINEWNGLSAIELVLELWR